MRYATIFGALCLLEACGNGDPGAPPPTASPGASATASSSTEARTFGPLWERARVSGDSLDIAELGRAEGGHGLLSGLDNDTYAAVARAALPGVPDAMVALPQLATRMRRGAAAALADGETLLAILAAVPTIGERLDPEGEVSAASDLLALARDETMPRETRAIAVSALRRLSERGLVEPARIPTELDDP